MKPVTACEAGFHRRYCSQPPVFLQLISTVHYGYTALPVLIRPCSRGKNPTAQAHRLGELNSNSGRALRIIRGLLLSFCSPLARKQKQKHCKKMHCNWHACHEQWPTVCASVPNWRVNSKCVPGQKGGEAGALSRTQADGGHTYIESSWAERNIIAAGRESYKGVDC